MNMQKILSFESSFRRLRKVTSAKSTIIKAQRRAVFIARDNKVVETFRIVV